MACGERTGGAGGEGTGEDRMGRSEGEFQWCNTLLLTNDPTSGNQTVNYERFEGR